MIESKAASWEVEVQKRASQLPYKRFSKEGLGVDTPLDDLQQGSLSPDHRSVWSLLPKTSCLGAHHNGPALLQTSPLTEKRRPLVLDGSLAASADAPGVLKPSPRAADHQPPSGSAPVWPLARPDLRSTGGGPILSPMFVLPCIKSGEF